MFIQSENISLRATEPADAPSIYHWENDRSVWQVSDTIMPYSLFQIEQFILNNTDLFSSKQIRLMIDSKVSKQTIGCIDLYDFDPFHERIGLGLLIAEPFRNKGFAGEAISLIEQYIFATLQLNQIYCLIGADNTHSIKLFEKAGYERCGVRKVWIKTPKGFIDQLEYQKINPDRIMKLKES
ncbi:MAG: GNAT family N-acetyltransferase [Bacteroidetes bacterium]|nr:GNAT family N-acetyltransferase [Bacteroidota bacterium]MBU1579983.1 GNAT family N-acetyltransferase [Bacteroidota bacterium]MBU2465076.1 GNAT family N-acetyltransferase [Bacteroidota bacterium]MBU2559014.1 GNAT family N-acetyltransferase [Bacteroidota bacterium]